MAYYRCGTVKTDKELLQYPIFTFTAGSSSNTIDIYANTVSDLTKWTKIKTLPGSRIGVAYGNGYYVFITNSGIYYTKDLVTFTSPNYAFDSSILSSGYGMIAYGSSRFIFTINGTSYYARTTYSSGAPIAFSLNVSTGSTSGDTFYVTYGKGKFIFGGMNCKEFYYANLKTITVTGSSTYYYLGGTSSATKMTNISNANGPFLLYAANRFFVTGTSSGYYSHNGTSWIASSGGPKVNRPVAYGAGKYCSIHNGVLSYSTNYCEVWSDTEVNLPQANVDSTYTYNEYLTYNCGRWIYGYSTSNITYYSLDALTWVAMSPLPKNMLYNVNTSLTCGGYVEG